MPARIRLILTLLLLLPTMAAELSHAHEPRFLQDEFIDASPSWEHALETGLNLSGGTIVDSGLLLRFRHQATLETPASMIRNTIDYTLTSIDDDPSENRASEDLYYEAIMSGRQRRYFAQGTFEYDEFKDWTRRLSFASGLSQVLLERAGTLDPPGEDEPLLEVTSRIGAGLHREYGSLETSIIPEGLMGLEVAWKITPLQSLDAGIRGYPDLGDLGEYRTAAYCHWTIRLDSMAGLHLKLGATHEYESQTDLGTDGHDLRAYLNLLLEL